LKRLEAVKLVKVRADKQRRIYELDRTGVDELATWLRDLRGFWASRFDALETALRK
jgi:DNA-binding PadR family transcriptional regulator